MWAHAENRKLPGASDSPAFRAPASAPFLPHPICQQLWVSFFFFFEVFVCFLGQKDVCVCVWGCGGVSVCNIVFHLISALNDALTVGRSTCHACGVCNTQFSRLLSSCCLVVVAGERGYEACGREEILRIACCLNFQLQRTPFIIKDNAYSLLRKWKVVLVLVLVLISSQHLS